MELDAPILLLSLVAAASFTVLLRLFARHASGQPLVEYEPRRPVPWNWLAPALILAPTLLTLATGMFGSAAEEIAPAEIGERVGVSPMPVGPSVAQGAAAVAAAAAFDVGRQLAEDRYMIPQMLMQSGSLVFLAATCYLLLGAACGATRVDLGLPTSWSQLIGDMGLGAGAVVAALLPVYLLQAALTTLFEPEHGHPLIEELVARPTPSMMAAAAIAAVVAAPIFEETAFRLLLQGWLERVEDEAIARQAAPMAPVQSEEFGHGEMASSGPRTLEPAVLPLAYGSARFASGRRPPGVVPALPHGWLPILVTAVLFSLAHFGHGVAPVSLLFLGLVLGYLYQRTHRIVPSMTCHAIFNLLSLAALWLAL